MRQTINYNKKKRRDKKEDARRKYIAQPKSRRDNRARQLKSNQEHIMKKRQYNIK